MPEPAQTKDVRPPEKVVQRKFQRIGELALPVVGRLFCQRAAAVGGAS